MMSLRSLFYIAVIQFAFSGVDIYARTNLREHSTLLSAIASYWFVCWLLLHALIAPFQIRLITRHGLGRGVALMNAFSVLYALVGGALVLHELPSMLQVISASFVVLAVWLIATPQQSSSVPSFTGDLPHEKTIDLPGTRSTDSNPDTGHCTSNGAAQPGH